MMVVMIMMMMMIASADDDDDLDLSWEINWQRLTDYFGVVKDLRGRRDQPHVWLRVGHWDRQRWELV